MIAGTQGQEKNRSYPQGLQKKVAQGIPVFLADIKEFICGLAKAGQWTPKLGESIQTALVSKIRLSHKLLFDYWDVLAKLVILFEATSRRDGVIASVSSA